MARAFTISNRFAALRNPSILDAHAHIQEREGSKRLRAEIETTKRKSFVEGLNEAQRQYYPRVEQLEAEIASLRAELAAERDESPMEPFERVHDHIRGAVLDAVQAIRDRDDLKAAHEILAAGAQRAANRLNSELKELASLSAELASTKRELNDAEEARNDAETRLLACRPPGAARWPIAPSTPPAVTGTSTLTQLGQEG